MRELNAPFAGTLLPPAAATVADPLRGGIALAASVGSGVRADADLLLALPVAPDLAGSVPVEVAGPAVTTCLAGTTSSGSVTVAVRETGTYALAGAARPPVAAVEGAWPLEAGAHARWAGQSFAALLCARQEVDVTVRVRNTGDRDWVRGTATQVVLGSSALPGNTRDFDAGVLVAPLYDRDRYATHAEPRVAPGATGTFTFRLRAPAASGTYRIDLRPVVEGVTWLEDEGIHVLLTVG